ncbi:hypothetical protein STEG23_023349, partial [Scotinomys teguina]
MEENDSRHLLTGNSFSGREPHYLCQPLHGNPEVIAMSQFRSPGSLLCTSHETISSGKSTKCSTSADPTYETLLTMAAESCLFPSSRDSNTGQKHSKEAFILAHSLSGCRPSRVQQAASEDAEPGDIGGKCSIHFFGSSKRSEPE